MSELWLAAIFVPFWFVMNVGARVLLFLTEPLKNPTEDVEGSL